MDKFMKQAIGEAFAGMRKNDGGPFGVVIVWKGKVVSKAHNEVIKSNDPTAHAEILALRRASKKLKNFDLSDCEIYSSCEPCPMCLAAIHWAKMKKLYYGCTQKDVAKIGFNDKFIYEVIKGTAKKKQFQTKQINRDECLKPFIEWDTKEDRIQY
jgi:guanine deaminase